MRFARRLLLASLVLGAGVMTSHAAHAGSTGTGDSYTVASGDSWYRIADRQGVSVAALLRANGRELSSVLLPGQRLVLPAGVAARPAAGAPAAPAAARPSGGAGSYTVVSGDSWYRIAGRHGVSVGALLRANGRELSSVLFPGQRLVLPAGAAAPAAPAQATPSVTPSSVTPSSTAPTAGGATTGSYTVVSGDGWFRIAQRLGVSVGALLQANGTELSSLLLPGQRLAVPAGASAPTSVVGGTASGPSLPTPTGVASAGNASVDAVVAYARDQLGKPYQFFTRGPDTFDCSGLVVAAYAQAGISLVHHSATQATQGRAVDLEREELRPGDLVFQQRRGAETINHVGIVVGPSTWIQATGPGDSVRIGRIPDVGTIAAVRRYIDG